VHTVHVTRHPEKGWQVTDSQGESLAVHDSQQASVAHARQWLETEGGGVVVIHGLSGRIQDRRTVVPAQRKGGGSVSSPRHPAARR
jgi:hypothetical protein